MVRLTADQINFLVANEEAVSLEELANIFNCTWQEVYKIYDIITQTERYREYVQECTDRICKKIKSGRDYND